MAEGSLRPSLDRVKHYQFTAIDDCIRIRLLRVYPRNNQKTAIQFLDYLLERLPFRVESIQTDNGTEFQSGSHWHGLDRGIRHTYITPATPRLKSAPGRIRTCGLMIRSHLLCPD